MVNLVGEGGGFANATGICVTVAIPMRAVGYGSVDLALGPNEPLKLVLGTISCRPNERAGVSCRPNERAGAAFPMSLCATAGHNVPAILGMAGELVLGPDELDDTVSEAPEPAVEGAPKGSAMATTERQQRMITTDETIQQPQV